MDAIFNAVPAIDGAAPPIDYSSYVSQPYVVGNLESNLFFRQCAATDVDALESRIRDESFKKFTEFCWSELRVMPEFTDTMLAEIGKLYFEKFAVTIFQWEQVEVRWVDWIRITKCLSPVRTGYDRYNIYALHEKNIVPFVQGDSFVQFMKLAEDYVQTVADKELAMDYAELMYRFLFDGLVGKKNNAPFAFPPWNREAFESYFYKINESEAVRRKQDDHIRRSIQKKTLEHTVTMQSKLDVLLSDAMPRYHTIAEMSAAVRRMIDCNK